MKLLSKEVDRSLWTLLAAVVVLAWGGSCAFSVTSSSDDESLLTLELSAFPDRVSVEDSTATAEVWATVKRGGQPISDSTRVVFATTVGTIEDSRETLDGLAVAVLTSPGDGRPRRAQIVAQAIAIRDTLEIDFVLSDQE